ncbi:hypothetical protein [Streptomyces sp. rh34]|uniref:hypothetical protein n=1 Tax=Streptomyces sp. rh34 TaxID=2034272 RepID=UPI000BF1E104|nr:hypothetical protein [Streptomyces sp. rh34]
MVTTAVITAALVPFVQTLVTKAAEDSYVVARDWLRRQFDREDAGEGEPESASRTLLVVRDPDPGLNVALCLVPDVSHEAIRALEHFDIEAVTAEAEPDAVTRVRVYWDEAAGSWQAERRRRRRRGN